MWIARDKDRTLWLYTNKPVKDSVHWFRGGFMFLIEPDAFPEVKWEDEEPTELITLPTTESIIDKLSDILGNYLHGGEIDEVIAEFETYLNKR